MQTVGKSHEFLRRATSIGMIDADITRLTIELAYNPQAGTALGHGLYKYRFARKGGGTRSGYRVIYYYRRKDIPLYILTVFAKNEKANITAKEKALLVEICDQIEDSFRRRK